MFCVYILYSPSSGKTYTGFTNDIQRRLIEHNLTETKDFTLRYRPWQLIYQENLETKKEAMAREQFLKSGKGRERVKAIVKEFLEQDRMRYPPQADSPTQRFKTSYPGLSRQQQLILNINHEPINSLNRLILPILNSFSKRNILRFLYASNYLRLNLQPKAKYNAQ